MRGADGMASLSLMQVDPSLYREIPSNEQGISAGCVLLPTDVAIVTGGGTSLDFIRQQGGEDSTFILIFGIRPLQDILGREIEILEGVFLNPSGPGFIATWDYDQLLSETRRGGWTVVETPEVLESWLEPVETRMNR